MKNKNKKGLKWGRDPESQLFKAAVRWIESKGWKVVLIGGLQIQHWPEDAEYDYRLAIKFTGQKPFFSKSIGNAPAKGGYMMRDDFAKKMNKKFSKQKQHRKKEMKK